MDILLVTDSYPPEIRSASHLMKELAEELKERGHNVFVVTCSPEYNLSDLDSEKSYPEYLVEDSIKVIRVKTLPHHKVNFIIRGISQLTLPHIFWKKIKKHIRTSVDATIVYSPPLPLGYVGCWMKKYRDSKFILNVQDIFPQNAIDLGALKNPLIIKYFEKMETNIYKFADKITVHSEGNKRFLIEKKKLSKDKIHILHNWVDIEAYRRFEGDGYYRKKLQIEGKFIFFFGGVMGPSQGLDLVIDAVDKLRNMDDIVFLFVGDGSEKSKMVEKVKARGLRNVIFHPFIPKDEYSKLLKEIDVGLVSLSNKNRTPVVPGKILGYMAAGIPVLGFLNKESDGHQIIREAGCGYTTVSDNSQKLAELMLHMYNERSQLRDMGFNGYMYATKHFSKKTCVDNLEAIIKK